MSTTLTVLLPRIPLGLDRRRLDFNLATNGHYIPCVVMCGLPVLFNLLAYFIPKLFPYLFHSVQYFSSFRFQHRYLFLFEIFFIYLCPLQPITGPSSPLFKAYMSGSYVTVFYVLSLPLIFPQPTLFSYMNFDLQCREGV